MLGLHREPIAFKVLWPRPCFSITGRSPRCLRQLVGDRLQCLLLSICTTFLMCWIVIVPFARLVPWVLSFVGRWYVWCGPRVLFYLSVGISVLHCVGWISVHLGADAELHFPSNCLDDQTAGLRMDCWHHYAHLLLFYCQFWLDVYNQTGQSTSYGLYRALMPYDCCVHLYPQDLVVRPLVLVGSDWTDMALSSPWHHMDEPEVSLGSRYVGPWVINLVPSSCMSFLQLKVGNRSLMIFTGWCWIICNFHYKINIIILTCEYHNVPPYSPLSHAFT